MEIFSGDYVRLNTGKIVRVKDVINKRHYSSENTVDYFTQDIYTDVRKKPYNISEILEHATNKETLDKRKKKETD